MLVVFVFGKLLKFNLEDIILASNANIGGPTTAVAMAISKGWVELVGPIMLVWYNGLCYRYIFWHFYRYYFRSIMINTNCNT